MKRRGEMLNFIGVGILSIILLALLIIVVSKFLK
jgi:hypothetical protein